MPFPKIVADGGNLAEKMPYFNPQNVSYGIPNDTVRS